MSHFSHKVVGLSLFVGSLSVTAQEVATVLPKGIFRSRVVQVVGREISKKYDGEGKQVPLAAPLNRTVTASDMAANNAQFRAVYNALNTIQAGLGDSLVQSNLYTDVRLNFQQTTVAQEYGLSSRLSLGVIVPYVFIQGKANFRADVINNVDAVRAQAGAQIAAALDQVEAGLPTTATYQDAIFTSNGYYVPENFSVRGLGDVEVGGKYSLVNIDNKFLVAVKSGFRLPTTTHVADQANLFDQSTGDKQLDYAAQGIVQWNATSQLSLHSALQATFQFADTQENRAVVKKGQSGLPSLHDASSRTDLRRDLGDMIEYEAGVGYGFFKNRLRPSVVYQFAAKTQDRYSGSNADLDYDSLAKNTWFNRHGAEAGLNYSTIPDYANKSFFMPLETKLSYSTTFYGKNTVKRDFYRFDFIAYF